MYCSLKLSLQDVYLVLEQDILELSTYIVDLELILTTILPFVISFTQLVSEIESTAELLSCSLVYFSDDWSSRSGQTPADL